MAFALNNNADIASPKDWDSRTGKFSGGAWIPFATIAEARTAVPTARRFVGLIARIGTPTSWQEYHYKAGITDNDLVLKTVAAPAPEIADINGLQDILDSKATKQPLVTLVGTSWNLINQPFVYQSVSGNPTYTISGGSAGDHGMLILNKTGTGNVTVNGNVYPTRDNGTTSLSVVVLPGGGYFIESGYTPSSSITTLTTPTFNATPISDTQINLTSITYDASSTGMVIRRATNAGMSANLSTIYTGSPKSSHNDTGRTASTQYFYDIGTTATGYTPSALATANATTPAAGLTPLTASALTMVPASSTAMDMNYTNVANETGYTVRIATDAGFTANVQSATKAANTTTHQFTGLTASTTYYGEVVANGDGVTYSNSPAATDSEATPATSITTVVEDFESTSVGNIPAGDATSGGATVQIPNYSGIDAPATGNHLLRFTATGATERYVKPSVIPQQALVSAILYKNTTLADTEYGVMQRANSATPGSITSGYYAGVRYSAVTAGVLLYKIGTTTPIAGVIPSTFFNSPDRRLYVEYEIAVSGGNHTHIVRCQRLIDGMWLDSTGTFVSGKTQCISIVDNTTTAAGRYGFWWYLATTTAADAVGDDLTATY